ncbi:MAG: 5'-deoxyadenosine deaminase [Luteitalea sp.]|nr:5'-deoxyadenosine deaminase [Luteitalea sp.]
MLLIRNARILTMNDRWDVVDGDVAIEDGRIVGIGPRAGHGTTPERVIDARGGLLLPGFVQTHVHLCQTIFRGLADDLRLLDWLRQRVFPLEAAHTPASLQTSARLAVAELLRTGTTTILTMETVHDTEAVLEALTESGIRATVGKCLMDRDAIAPARMQQAVTPGIEEALALHRRWHGAARGRIRVALAPRFALSCSREMLEAVADVAHGSGLLVHTHAAEQRDEVDLVRKLTNGLGNVEYFVDVGLGSARLCLAHCVWVDETEQALLAQHDVKVLHCPGSNAKLGSGIAPVTNLRARGITVSLGADGAACNNRLDMFDEMRLAATLQALRAGPGQLAARDVVWMATRAGARTLGLELEIGSIETGKRADLIVVETHRAHLAPGDDPYSTLVYACHGTDVRTVLVDGEVLVDDFTLSTMDEHAVVDDARREVRALVARARL